MRQGSGLHYIGVLSDHGQSLLQPLTPSHTIRLYYIYRHLQGVISSKIPRKIKFFKIVLSSYLSRTYGKFGAGLISEKPDTSRCNRIASALLTCNPIASRIIGISLTFRFWKNQIFVTPAFSQLGQIFRNVCKKSPHENLFALVDRIFW